jgi:molybdate transport system ATP-binding protein
MSLLVDIAHPLGNLDLAVTFEAPAGITALFGRSGSGKTTVVNVVAGLLRPRRARIVLAGQTLCDTAAGIDLAVHRRRLGYVFQDDRLFPHLSVRQNLTYGLRFAPRAASGPDPGDVAEMLGITALLNRRPGALSGGEKQRVAIGRALLARPRLLLMDEPLAALDSARKQEILPYLERLRDHTDIPMLYVSHSLAEVARLATHVVVLDDGRVARSGNAEQVLSDPALVRQLGLREAGAVLPAVIERHHDDGLSELRISGGRLLIPAMDRPPGTRTRLRILAQDVIVATSAPDGLSALNILPCEVVTIRDGHGPGVIVQLRCGDDHLLARITRRSATALDLAPGRPVFAVIKSVSIARTDISAG